MPVPSSSLPIESVLPDVRRALRQHPSAVLTAPPGAGKTTGVPLALMAEPWLAGRRIVMLEPRRLAAKAAALRMARTLGESVGETVGYRIRHESHVGARTRVEVVTEGILTRMLQHDPSLQEYGCVVFDEFHERSLQADLGLALCVEARRLFREDLRILLMSATLDAGPVARLLGGAPVIASEGRSFPVEVRYLDRPLAGPLDPAVADTVRRVLKTESGSVLVFLPGMAEIRRVERRLLEGPLGSDVHLAPLHGELPQDQQDAALAPAPPGRRKVVLATSLAETSLTIEGVRVVIDAGLLRVPRFDPRSGLSRLDTVRVTRDAADQRCGRAGRLEPGVCYRLWTANDQSVLLPRRPPEILDADVASLVLEVAVWGAANPFELSWLDPPPAGMVAQATGLLQALGALDSDGHATAHGRRLVELGLHPRLAHMIVAAGARHATGAACDVAALLSERDVIRMARGTQRSDLQLRLDLLRGVGAVPAEWAVDRAAMARARRAADQWRRQLRVAPSQEGNAVSLGGLLALAYPDRVAQRLPAGPADAARYRLANGRGACFPGPEVLAAEDYLVVAHLDGNGEWARIELAAAIQRDELAHWCAGSLQEVDFIDWDDRSQSVQARRQVTLGALVLRDQGLPRADPEAVRRALCEGIARAGLARLPWTPEVEQWRARVALLRRVEGPASAWPDVSDEALAARLDEWLGPALEGLTRLDQLARVDVGAALCARLSWKQQQELDRAAPTHLTVPTGSRVRLDYMAGKHPVLAVRLQELFGCVDTPRVANGRVPVLLHLLSPAGRPVQVTQDLARFWATSYFDVRKELRGRYPKHHWPDNPLAAAPTRRAKRPGERERA